MSNRRLVDAAIEELRKNPEQFAAVHEKGDCVVLAGPGSGKTKTLTTAMARAILEDVQEPRGIACITYNNECALELEGRLSKLGVEPSGRIFIGTVHGFALSQVIIPYASCVDSGLTFPIEMASGQDCANAIEQAYQELFHDGGNPKQMWKAAEEKRRRDIDRAHPVWKGRNKELAEFVERYEEILHEQGLIDFDDMPLIAYRLLSQHEWIRQSIAAKFPILFIDEYQDLGHALHGLVLLLCFGAGVRLFAVGDPDQSIYAFTGANPELLESLSQRAGVTEIRLRLNYRCATKIIEASKAALEADRGYAAPDGRQEGVVYFHGVDGDASKQAEHIVKTVIPAIQKSGVPLEQIAVLYRAAKDGKFIDEAAGKAGIPIVKADNDALIKRGSRLGRFIEACASWVRGGWKDANPKFSRLVRDAAVLVYGWHASEEEQQSIEVELISFLNSQIGGTNSTYEWLTSFNTDVLSKWKRQVRTISDDWDVIDEILERLDENRGGRDLPLDHFAGRIAGSGRLNLSTLHSAKGREFDAVILFGMNAGSIPNRWEQQDQRQGREARRLFYVGVTRARDQLHVTFAKGGHSPWVKELHDRVNTKP